MDDLKQRLIYRSGKFLSHFVANVSKTLHISFHQNRSSIVEVILVCFMPQSRMHPRNRLTEVDVDSDLEVCTVMGTAGILR